MEKLPFLMFREHSSLEYALLISEKSSYKGAARDVTYTSVPGRSGDLLTDNGRYKNITIPYKLSLLNTTDRSFAVLAHQIKGWLLSEALSLSFNCKPLKYSFEGQTPVVFTAGGSLYNAEFFPSSPYIKITGSDTVTLTINNASFTFSDIDEYIEIDSEAMNAYKGTVAKNNKMTGAGFPTLAPGKNVIAWTGNVTRLEIVPRWCCL